MRSSREQYAAEVLISVPEIRPIRRFSEIVPSPPDSHVNFLRLAIPKLRLPSRANFLQGLGHHKGEIIETAFSPSLARQRRGRLDSRRALIVHGLRKYPRYRFPTRERERESNQFYAVDYSPTEYESYLSFLLLFFPSSLFRRHLLIFTRRASVTDRIGGQIIRADNSSKKRGPLTGIITETRTTKRGKLWPRRRREREKKRKMDVHTWR